MHPTVESIFLKTLLYPYQFKAQTTLIPTCLKDKVQIPCACIQDPLQCLQQFLFSSKRTEAFFFFHIFNVPQTSPFLELKNSPFHGSLYSDSKFKWFSPWRLPHILLLFKFMLEFPILSPPLIIYVCCLYKQMQLSSNEMMLWAKEYIL